ncbi:DUF2231 domain-containing protein [Bdellovibrio bacteriovorus]
MYSKAKIGNHPIHPMLVAFPITLYALTFVGFVVYATASSDIFWYNLAYFCNYAGVAMAFIAAIPGFVDWAVGIPNNTVAKKDGMIHMTLNLITLGLFAINAIVIRGTWNLGADSVATPITLTGLGTITLLCAGFYGWKMVSEHKVGVMMSKEQAILQDRYEKEFPYVPPKENRNEPPTYLHH